MTEPRAQRTLVKSPPELWAEVSDASLLARHLGEFGDIRITRLEAETTVVWEGDRARGTVEIEASGWGTKVTITAEAIAVAEAEVEPEPEPEPEPVAVVEPEPEPAPVAAAPPRRGFFARLFGRKAPEPVVAPEPEPVAALPEPIVEPDLAGEITAQSTMDDGQVEAVLVGVLDDLGSAHHRPFSRG
jgi:hypothetical protein